MTPQSLIFTQFEIRFFAPFFAAKVGLPTDLPKYGLFSSALNATFGLNFQTANRVDDKFLKEPNTVQNPGTTDSMRIFLLDYLWRNID